MLIDCHHWTWQQATHACLVLYAGPAALEKSRENPGTWYLMWERGQNGGKKEEKKMCKSCHLYSFNLELKVEFQCCLSPLFGCYCGKHAVYVHDYVIFKVQGRPACSAVRLFAYVHAASIATSVTNSLFWWSTCYFSVVTMWHNVENAVRSLLLPLFSPLQ